MIMPAMRDPAVNPIGDGKTCNAVFVVSRSCVLRKYGARLDICCARKSVCCFLPNVYQKRRAMEVVKYSLTAQNK